MKNTKLIALQDVNLNSITATMLMFAKQQDNDAGKLTAGYDESITSSPRKFRSLHGPHHSSTVSYKACSGMSSR